MDVTPQIPEGRALVEAYGNGGFKLGGHRYEHSILILESGVQKWDIASFDEITPENLQAIFDQTPKPEVVLIGVGEAFRPIKSSLRNVFRGQGIAVDAMDTGAACRTFNILLAEGRRVAVALIAV